MTNVHHPAPINQFYRLDYDEIRKAYVKTSRWNHQHLINGRYINYDGVLCMATAGAVALDAHTGGRIRVSPGQIHDHQGDLSGGIGVDDVQKSWANGWSQTLLTPANYGWDDIMQVVKVQRRNVVLGLDYEDVPYDYQVQKGGTFDHAINVDDYRGTDGRILRYDSLDTKAVWTPQSAYRKAAETLALRVRGNRGQLFCGLTAVRPLISVDSWNVSVHPQKGTPGYPSNRYFGLYTVVNDIVTSVITRRTGGFSATADLRNFYTYPGHSRQELVRLTSGFLKGKYVRAGYIVED